MDPTQNFDFVSKAYGNLNNYNLIAGDDSGDDVASNVQISPGRISLDIQTANGSYSMILNGDFTVGDEANITESVAGTIDDWQVFSNGVLSFEEIYPAGTSAAAWSVRDYAFEMSLITGNDFFAGSPVRHDESRDGIRGGTGNDTFIGYGSVGGSDYFFGEAGIDTAIYQGALREYTITTSDDIWDGRLNDGTRASGIVVTDQQNARDDTDELVSVERLQFSDVTLALDIDGVAAEAYRIYKAAFDRQPDSQGLGFWIKQMDAGMGIETVAEQFISSAEFIGMYGANPSDEQFVDLLYANVLDRQADQSGYDFWIGALDRGLTRAGLLAEFSESTENVANVEPLIADGIQYTAFVG